MKNGNLSILVEGKEATAEFGSKTVQCDVGKQPILVWIDTLVQDPRRIKSIKVTIESATFSTVRQIVAAVNTMAWALRVTVNGKLQMKVAYDREPNITV